MVGGYTHLITEIKEIHQYEVLFQNILIIYRVGYARKDKNSTRGSEN